MSAAFSSTRRMYSASGNGDMSSSLHARLAAHAAVFRAVRILPFLFARHVAHRSASPRRSHVG